MTLSRRFSKLNPSYIFLALAILVGGYIRLAAVLQSPLPLGDGGMFFVMVQDLIAGKFHLPTTITYNHLDLPYVYPPLALYLGGFISKIFQIDLIDIIRLLPAFFTILTIPAFFVFVKNFIKNEFQLIIATLIFSLLPPTFDWLIMGGGLTRAPGFFFTILTLHFIYRLYTENKIKNIVWASIFSALTVLTHPQLVLFAIVSAVVFFMFLERNKSGLKKSVYVGFFTLLLASPWWGTVLLRSGFSPFLAAAKTGGYYLNSLIGFFKFDLTKEIGLESIGVLGSIGIFLYLSEKKYFIPVWFLIAFIIDPRSAPRHLALLFPIFSSYTLIKLFSFFDNSGNSTHDLHYKVIPGTISKIFFAILIGQWVFSSYSTALILKESSSLTKEDKAATDWISTHTPPQSKFLILTGLQPLSDPFSEWLPALTDRESLATTQGKEWDTTLDFDEILLKYWKTQNCMNKGKACFDDLELEFNKPFEYIYIRGMSSSSRLDLDSYNSATIDSLQASGEFDLVYKDIDIAILQRK